MLNFYNNTSILTTGAGAYKDGPEIWVDRPLFLSPVLFVPQKILAYVYIDKNVLQNACFSSFIVL